MPSFLLAPRCIARQSSIEFIRLVRQATSVVRSQRSPPVDQTAEHSIAPVVDTAAETAVGTALAAVGISCSAADTGEQRLPSESPVQAERTEEKSCCCLSAAVVVFALVATAAAVVRTVVVACTRDASAVVR